MSAADSSTPALPRVQYRQLGKSGLRVSVPILGAMSFGSKEWGPWVLEADEALPVLKAAWDLGINTIDTANVYSMGKSEEIVGRFLKEVSSTVAEAWLRRVR
ncbi:NADP-dependent oxidoreductase domain-containing protein [Schizophyllum fasciatum]